MLLVTCCHLKEKKERKKGKVRKEGKIEIEKNKVEKEKRRGKN